MSTRFNIAEMTAVFDREMDDVPVILITLKIPGVDPIYLSTDNTERLEIDNNDVPVYGTVSNGIQYIFCPVEITLPSSHGEEAHTSTLTLSNVTRELVEYIRNYQTEYGYPTVRFQVILISPDDPASADYVVADYPELNVTEVEYNQTTITASIEVNSLHGEAFPGKSFTPDAFPSLFGMVR